jgi:hypothetical protein
MAPPPGRVWGRQQPFERQHLQRAITLLSLGTLATSLVALLASAHPARALGSALVSVGLACTLAAASRQRYVREARVGFAILASRDGRFVLGTALVFLVVAGLAVLVVLG